MTRTLQRSLVTGRRLRCYGHRLRVYSSVMENEMVVSIAGGGWIARVGSNSWMGENEMEKSSWLAGNVGAWTRCCQGIRMPYVLAGGAGEVLIEGRSAYQEGNGSSRQERDVGRCERSVGVSQRGWLLLGVEDTLLLMLLWLLEAVVYAEIRWFHTTIQKGFLVPRWSCVANYSPDNESLEIAG